MPWGLAAVAVGGIVSSALAPEPPDPNPGIERSAAASERVGMAQVDLAERQRQDALQRNAKLDAITQRVTDAQITSMGKNDALADEYANYNRTTFRPLEQGIVSEATTAGTAADQELEAGKAGAEAKQALTQVRAGQNREMFRMGVNPNSGRFNATTDATSLNAAVAEGAAENAARSRAKELGFAKRMDAASLGRGLASSQATSAGIALNAGNSAVANNVAANNSVNASASTTSGILSAGNTAFGTAAGGYNAASQQAAAIYGIQAKQASDMGAAIGSAGGMYYAANNKK